jgi:hypothetical protein
LVSMRNLGHERTVIASSAMPYQIRTSFPMLRTTGPLNLGTQCPSVIAMCMLIKQPAVQ